MAKTKVAINGFGRIGRSAFKVAFEVEDIEIVAINDLSDTATLGYLLQFDSNYGRYSREVSTDENHITVDDTKIPIYAEKDPAALPWGNLGVDVVIESTGIFTDAEKAGAHLKAGAKKVVISAPAKGDGVDTVVLGVNDDAISTISDVASNASCTTNNITPVAAVIEREFGIEKAMMSTIHAYTASQALQDRPDPKDLRRGRAAAENIVPSSSGATQAAAKALPQLEDRFGGMAFRVPVQVVSVSDLTIVTKRDVSAEEVNAALTKAASEPALEGILAVTEKELVSSDFIGDAHSATVDLGLTQVVGGNLLKVVAWYDNEWGYSNRLVELVTQVGGRLN